MEPPSDSKERWSYGGCNNLVIHREEKAQKTEDSGGKNTEI